MYVGVGERTHALERLVFGQLNTLNTQAALFHDTAGADDQIGVQYHGGQRAFDVEIEFRIFGVVVPVEAAHLIRTVVGAVTRSNAAVIDLLIEPLGTGGGRQHRTNRFAGSVLTVLAHHGLMHADRVFFRAAVVTIDAQPVHDANALHLVLADDGNVVFRLTGDHAGRASCAGVHVDRHAPGVFALKALRPQVGQRFAFARLPRFRFAVHFFERGFKNDGPAFHGKMCLGGGQGLFTSV